MRVSTEYMIQGATIKASTKPLREPTNIIIIEALGIKLPVVTFHKLSKSWGSSIARVMLPNSLLNLRVHLVYVCFIFNVEERWVTWRNTIQQWKYPFFSSDRSLKATTDFSLRIYKTGVWVKKVERVKLSGKIYPSNLMIFCNSTLKAL